MYLISLVTTALVGSPPSAYIATAVKNEVDPFRAIVDFFEATPGRRRPPRDRPPATTRSSAGHHASRLEPLAISTRPHTCKSCPSRGRECSRLRAHPPDTYAASIHWYAGIKEWPPLFTVGCVYKNNESAGRRIG